jgi:hypothetical protein
MINGKLYIIVEKETYVDIDMNKNTVEIQKLPPPKDNTVVGEVVQPPPEKVDDGEFSYKPASYETLDESVCHTFVKMVNIEKRYFANNTQVGICTYTQDDSSKRERIKKLGSLGSFDILSYPLYVSI